MRALVMCAALVGTISAAHADWHYETTYRDLVRPNGQPRSDAVYQADLDVCGRQTHVKSTLAPVWRRSSNACLAGTGAG
jgi:hypothetical protein